MITSYFYNLLASYIKYHVGKNDRLVEIDPENAIISSAFPGNRIIKTDKNSQFRFNEKPADAILIQGNLHYVKDIQLYLEHLHTLCQPHTRLIIVYYSALWRPVVKIATAIGLRKRKPEENWLGHEDMENLLVLSGFEKVQRYSRILIPFYIPLVSWFANRFLAPMPLIRHFCLVNFMVARPYPAGKIRKPSVSVIIPARNEAGNIENIIKRMPKIGTRDELVFIEGHSTDETWERILHIKKRYGKKKNILAARQDGTGKGDAVRKGFSMATGELLVILDADLTVAPEDLPKFYDAFVSGKGEFLNGSRLVYPMEGEAMRFFNMVGNKFFAAAFSYLLGHRFKDTLCGTKAISRQNYLRLSGNRFYFGEFDPFGDFDLIFGAAKLGLKITEIPVAYKKRTYGQTNISRWTHGWLLLKMLLFAFKKIRFI